MDMELLKGKEEGGRVVGGLLVWSIYKLLQTLPAPAGWLRLPLLPFSQLYLVLRTLQPD